MSFELEINDLQNTYKMCKNLGQLEEFCRGIFEYCKLIGFDRVKSETIMGIISGCEPNIGQSWKDVRCYENEEVELFSKLKKEIFGSEQND